jgi:hypothetical protein
MTTTKAKRLGFYPQEKRQKIGTRMGGLGNRIELAVIRSTWEIFRDGDPAPIITGAKTRKEALLMLSSSLAR